jgi:hypothetical protein
LCCVPFATRAKIAHQRKCVGETGVVCFVHAISLARTKFLEGTRGRGYTTRNIN